MTLKRFLTGLLLVAMALAVLTFGFLPGVHGAAQAQDNVPVSRGTDSSAAKTPEDQQPGDKSDAAQKDDGGTDLKPETSSQPSDTDRNKAVEEDADLAFGAFQRGYYLTAVELALPRANLGDPAAQTLLGEIYSKGLGLKQDQKEAVSWYRLAAQAGDRQAQFAYGMSLLDGVGVTKDIEAAKEMLAKAAAGDHVQALYNLSNLEISERPVASVYATALERFKRAGELGSPESQYAAAQLLAQGLDGLGPREKAARKWMELAAENDVLAAQIELGVWLANGRGGPQDAKGAFEWLHRAAMKANPVAQNRIAHMYRDGFGVERNPVEAAKWHILARRAGLSDTVLDSAFNRLKQDERAEALSLANIWPRKPTRDPFKGTDAPPVTIKPRDLAPPAAPDGAESPGFQP